MFRTGPGERVMSLFRSRSDLEILLSTYSRQYINCLIGEAFLPLRALVSLEGSVGWGRQDRLSASTP